MRKVILGALVGGAMLLGACGGSTDAADPNAELANATGDATASLDEMATGGGFARLMIPKLQRPELMRQSLGHQVADFLLPSAEAAGCAQETFTACSSGVRTRTFDGCSIGPATLNGSVELDFSDSACGMSASSDSVTRKANFTLTGPNGGTITVSSPDGGQKVTNNGDGTFNYEVLGMHRVGTDAGGKTVFDVSTSTSAPIGVTGTSRSNRVINGGTLVVQHNLAGVTATLSPSNVTWDGTCNCPVSGSWSGTRSGNKTGSFTVTLTGCGTGTVTTADGTKNVTFDRCSAL
jgi:hypothetical protein